MRLEEKYDNASSLSNVCVPPIVCASVWYIDIWTAAAY